MVAALYRLLRRDGYRILRAADGAVFRFHIKPWDDDALRATVAEAFRYHWFRHDAGQPA